MSKNLLQLVVGVVVEMIVVEVVGIVAEVDVMGVVDIVPIAVVAVADFGPVFPLEGVVIVVGVTVRAVFT